MRKIEDFTKQYQSRLSSPAKGAFTKLTTFCDTTPQGHIDLLEHEFSQMGGQIYVHWQAVRAAVEKHLGL